MLTPRSNFLSLLSSDRTSNKYLISLLFFSHPVKKKWSSMNLYLLLINSREISEHFLNSWPQTRNQHQLPFRCFLQPLWKTRTQSNSLLLVFSGDPRFKLSQNLLILGQDIRGQFAQSSNSSAMNYSVYGINNSR